jgi:hypothetical protein
MLASPAAHASSGLYYGFDFVSHSLATQVDLRQTFIPAPPDATEITNASSERFSDAGLRLGYKYRRRAGDIFYIAPELTLSQLDSSGLNYSTTLLFGAQSTLVSPYVIAGLGHIDKFDKNQFSYGLGAEINISENICINLTWQRIDTMREESSASIDFGSQTLTTTSSVGRDIDIIMLGITFYSHE